ncbi:MAG: outer membrane lipoprotein carrier protein LolA [Desulfobacteraceae bacterium]|nr:MAG: outer membrane lipoprotein carrier protein LolA [Desulfobacteraceae bacterium]
MKRFLYILCSSFFLISGALAEPWAGTLEQIRKEAAGVFSVRAEFTQEKHMKMLAKPLISTGVVLFKSPKSIRWEYFKPVQSILMMDDGRVKRFIEGEAGLVEDLGPGKEIMQFVLQEITYWLKGRFDDSPNFTTTLQSGRTITLTPKEESFSRMIERIELRLSDQPGVMESVKIIENQDTYTEYTFQNTQVNIPLDDVLFRKI